MYKPVITREEFNQVWDYTDKLPTSKGYYKAAKDVCFDALKSAVTKQYKRYLFELLYDTVKSFEGKQFHHQVVGKGIFKAIKAAGIQAEYEGKDGWCNWRINTPDFSLHPSNSGGSPSVYLTVHDFGGELGATLFGMPYRAECISRDTLDKANCYENFESDIYHLTAFDIFKVAVTYDERIQECNDAIRAAQSVIDKTEKDFARIGFRFSHRVNTICI